MIEEKTQRKDAKTQRRKENGINPLAPFPLSALALSILIVFLAAVLRFHNLGAQSFWNDEGSSYVQSTRSFADIASNAARDIHPPGYYWLLSIWRQFVGDSEFALRSLSAFASVLTIAFTYALGKRLFNSAAGLAAALFVALNTFSIYYAQEARMYALLALWSVMGMWGLARALSYQSPVSSFQRKNLGTWIFLALVNAAGFYTQYAYPFVMLAQGAIFLVWLVTRIKTGNWQRVTVSFVAANLLTILLYLPWLPTTLTQVTQWPSTGETIPAGEALQTIGGWFLFGSTYTAFRGNMTVVTVLMLLALILFPGGLGRWNAKRSFWHVLLPVLWVIVPAGLFLALGLFRPANLKFLLPSQIGFALLIGLGLARFWEGFKSWGFGGMLIATASTIKSSIMASRLLAGLVTFFLLAFFPTLIAKLYTDPTYQRPDYRTMVATITAAPRPGDAIILDAPNQEEVFRYYYKNDASVYPLPPGLGGNDAETAALTQDIINRHDRIFVLFWGEAERDPNHIVETALDSQTFQAGIDQWYGDVRFAVYVTPTDMPDLTPSDARFGDSITLVAYALSATTIQSGDVLQVRLDWQTAAPLTTPYKVFLQLLNSDGKVVTQRDAEPGGGSLPTTGWTFGETVTDRHGLTIPADLPNGSYQLILGMYNRDNPSARLPIGTGDYLDLGSITIGG
jgi:mannosyltransferase